MTGSTTHLESNSFGEASSGLGHSYLVCSGSSKTFFHHLVSYLEPVIYRRPHENLGANSGLYATMWRA